MEKVTIDNMSLKEIELFAESIEEKRYRAKQLFKWVYQKNITDLDQMTDLAKSFREKLKSILRFTELKQLTKLTSKIDGTTKFLFELEDGYRVESVVLIDGARVTGCISSQVGCKMGCKFCETAKIGFKRNLSSGEIVRQVLHLKQYCLDNDMRLQNLVFMGMGEPLDNLENVMKALEIISDDNGVSISAKKITVSTCGLADSILELYTLPKPPNLAISINASSSKERSKLMPINDRYQLSYLMEKLKELPVKRRDRITLEYVMIDHINSHLDDAKRLSVIASQVPCKINLIPYNSGSSEYKTPPLRDIIAFQNYLINKGFSVFIRKSLGQDIMGACGQLYAGFEVKNNN